MKLTVKYVIEHEQELWNSIRWDNATPTCTCGSQNLYKLSDGRFKCKCCKSVFSDTSNTIMKNSNLRKWQWLYAIFTLSTTRSISVREMSRHIGVSVSTAHKMLRKVRYYMSLDKIEMTNVAIIDEAHLGAWANMTLRKKFQYMRDNNFIGKNDKTYTKSQIFAASSDKKEHIVCLINEQNQCIIKHIRGQVNHKVMKTLIKQHNIKHIISDESKLYLNIPNTTVEQCNHSKGVWLTPNGNTTNPCENRFSWVKRIYNSYHTHTSADNLQLYLNQIAFKINHTGQPTEQVFLKLGRLCCTEYVSHTDITNYLRENELSNPREEIDPEILEMLNWGFVEKVEHKQKVYRRHKD